MPGESCLHIATVYGDFESVKLLVSNGAYINQRATGRFFLPEDQKLGGDKKETNYQGLDCNSVIKNPTDFWQNDVYDKEEWRLVFMPRP